jgi:hypothetical protein
VKRCTRALAVSLLLAGCGDDRERDEACDAERSLSAQSGARQYFRNCEKVRAARATCGD